MKQSKINYKTLIISILFICKENHREVFLSGKKKPHRGRVCIVGETRISNCATDEEKFLKTIHYGLRKVNKIFVTFATINNN